MCACPFPNTGACHDACVSPTRDAEAECAKLGYASCKEYCLVDMGLTDASECAQNDTRTTPACPADCNGVFDCNTGTDEINQVCADKDANEINRKPPSESVPLAYDQGGVNDVGIYFPDINFFNLSSRMSSGSAQLSRRSLLRMAFKLALDIAARDVRVNLWREEYRKAFELGKVDEQRAPFALLLNSSDALVFSADQSAPAPAPSPGPARLRRRKDATSSSGTLATLKPFDLSGSVLIADNRDAIHSFVSTFYHTFGSSGFSAWEEEDNLRNRILLRTLPVSDSTPHDGVAPSYTDGESDGETDGKSDGEADVCACPFPNTGACHDACVSPTRNAEAECARLGYASCKEYCLVDMGLTDASECISDAYTGESVGSSSYAAEDDFSYHDICDCEIPDVRSCNDACRWPSVEVEEVCKRMGFASCGDYCETDMVLQGLIAKDASECGATNPNGDASTNTDGNGDASSSLFAPVIVGSVIAGLMVVSLMVYFIVKHKKKMNKIGVISDSLLESVEIQTAMAIHNEFENGGSSIADRVPVSVRLDRELKDMEIRIRKVYFDGIKAQVDAARLQDFPEDESIDAGALQQLKDAERETLEAEACLFAAKFLLDFEPTVDGEMALTGAFHRSVSISGGSELIRALQKRIGGDPDALETFNAALDQTLAGVLKESAKYQLALARGKAGRAVAANASLQNRLARRLKAAKSQTAIILAETAVVAPGALPPPADAARAVPETAITEEGRLDLEAAFKQAYLEGLRHQLMIDRGRLGRAAGTTDALRNRLAAKIRASEALLDQQLACNKAAVFADRFLEAQGSLQAGSNDASSFAHAVGADDDVDSVLRSAHLASRRQQLAIDRARLARRNDLDAALKNRLTAQIDANVSKLDKDEKEFLSKTSKSGNPQRQLEPEVHVEANGGAGINALAREIALQAAFDVGTRQQLAIVGAGESALDFQQKVVAAAKTELAMTDPEAALRVAKDISVKQLSAGQKGGSVLSGSKVAELKVRLKASYLEGLRTLEDDQTELETRLRKARLIDIRRQLKVDRQKLEKAAKTDLTLKNRLLKNIQETEIKEAEESAMIQVQDARVQLADDKAEAFAAQFIEVLDTPGGIVDGAKVPTRGRSSAQFAASLGGNVAETSVDDQAAAAAAAAAAEESTLKTAMDSAMRAAFQQGTRQTLAWKREEANQRLSNTSKVQDRLAARLAATQKVAVVAAKHAKAATPKLAAHKRRASIPRTVKNRTASVVARDFVSNQRMLQAQLDADRSEREEVLRKRLKATKSKKAPQLPPPRGGQPTTWSTAARANSEVGHVLDGAAQNKMRLSAEMQFEREQAALHREARMKAHRSRNAEVSVSSGARMSSLLGDLPPL